MGRKLKSFPKGERLCVELGGLEESYDILFAVDEKARLVYVGKSFSRLLGQKKEELCGRKVTVLFSGKERRELNAAISMALEKRGMRDVVLRLGPNCYSFSVVPAWGEPSRLAFLGRKTVSAEEELRMVRLSRIVERMEESVCLTDLNHTILYVNPAMTRMLGFSREEMEGKRAADFFENVPGNPKDLYKLAEKEAREGGWRREIFLRRKAGTIFPIELTLDTVMDERGRKIGYVGVSREITERKELHGQLVQAEKMAAVGQLASGLAHEFNNLIAIISGRVQFARSKGTNEEKDRALEVILRMCERATDVTRSLLSFARRVELRKELSDVVDVLESILAIVGRDIKADCIRIVRRYTKVPKVVLDRAQVQQVFLNILINARHSMPSGGKLTMRIRKEGKDVAVSFTDTGVGINREDLDRIFEPFMTTKGAVSGGAFSGCGFGLSVSYGIVEQHGGEISVKSTAGKGSTFTVRLPIAPPRRLSRRGRPRRRSAGTVGGKPGRRTGERR